MIDTVAMWYRFLFKLVHFCGTIMVQKIDLCFCRTNKKGRTRQKMAKFIVVFLGRRRIPLSKVLGYKSGSTGHDNVKQLKLAALKMSQVGNNVKNCKASIRLNSFPKGKYKYLTKKN